MAAPVYEGLSGYVDPSEVDSISFQVYAMSEAEVLSCIEYMPDPITPGYYLLPDGKGAESVSYDALVEHARKQRIGELYKQVHDQRASKMASYVTTRMETSGRIAAA